MRILSGSCWPATLHGIDASQEHNWAIRSRDYDLSFFWPPVTEIKERAGRARRGAANDQTGQAENRKNLNCVGSNALLNLEDEGWMRFLILYCPYNRGTVRFHTHAGETNGSRDQEHET